MEVDKVANMMVKIPNEDFTDVTLAIGDIFGDDVRGGDGGLGVVYMEIHKVADEVGRNGGEHGS